uniref:Integrase catalytic domain-containing protein n=1 Tax=Amphimedon queenslandica TaxID=400682 RepID=A0A1X7TMT1_AMPQE
MTKIAKDQSVKGLKSKDWEDKCEVCHGPEYSLTLIDNKTRAEGNDKEIGQVVKRLRPNNGGEYTSTEFQSYLKAEGITHKLTVPKSPEQNGEAEQLNRTFVEAVRSMLIGSQLPQSFWAEALSIAVYLRNRSPTKSVNGLTPYEALSVFSCMAYAHIPKEERRKLDIIAKRRVLVGYGTTVKGYCQYCPENRIIYSRDVKFDESS